MYYALLSIKIIDQKMLMTLIIWISKYINLASRSYLIPLAKKSCLFSQIFFGNIDLMW